MQTKLTLRIDEELIEQAKAVASANGTSLSRMVEAWFARLTLPTEPSGAWVDGLRGVVDLRLDDAEVRREHHEAVLRKHSP